MDDLATEMRERAKKVSNVLAFARVCGDEGAIRTASAVLAEVIQKADEIGIDIDVAPALRAAALTWQAEG